MGKEYILPWSCKSQKKFFRVLLWIGLIGFPILFVTGILDALLLRTPDFVPYVIFGFFGSFFLWISSWACSLIDFPTFKCKTEASIT